MKRRGFLGAMIAVAFSPAIPGAIAAVEPKPILTSSLIEQHELCRRHDFLPGEKFTIEGVPGEFVVPGAYMPSGRSLADQCRSLGLLKYA